jgi:hypothetical protein
MIQYKLEGKTLMNKCIVTGKIEPEENDKCGFLVFNY